MTRLASLSAAAAIASAALLCVASPQKGAKPTDVKIVRLDPRFDQLVPQSAVLEKIAEGFTWVEGPAWNRKERFLLFSDIPDNAIVRWNRDGGTSVFQKPSGYTGTAPYEGPEPGSNGLAFDAQGRLVICEHGDRRVTRVEPNGQKTVLADRYEGKRFNSPNDLAIRSNGDVYFTDPPYGLPKTFKDPNRELDFLGVYRVTPQRVVMLLTQELSAPNGIAFSPDQKTLYVANSDRNRPIWMAYEVKADGTLSAGRVFVDATPWMKEGSRGVPDGMKVDRSGNLFASGPGGINVIAPDGTRLGYFSFGVSAANCAWGDDGSTLYIAVSSTLYRIALRTRGY